MSESELGRAVLELSTDDAKFFTNLDEAKNGVKSFQQQVQLWSGQVQGNFKGASDSAEAFGSAIADVFGDQLEQRAKASASGILQLGDATKLTSDEVKQHLGILNDWIAKAEKLGRDVPAHVLETRDALAKLNAEGAKGLGAQTFDDLTDHVKATALGFISAQAIIGTVEGAFHTLTEFVGSSIEAYGNAEVAAKKMTVALQTQGTATPAVIAHFDDLATQVQRTTVNSDDMTQQMEALLTEVGDVAPAKMGRALQAATDLAAGLGVDLQTATVMVAKAFAGHTESLGRYGITIDAAKVKTEGMTVVLDAIQQRFGGQAQAEAETYAGKIKQLANEWDNFKEAVGRSIVDDPLIAAALGRAKDGITGVGESADAYRPTITDWWASLVGGSSFGLVIGYFNSIDQALKGLNGDLAKRPPAPAAFQAGPDAIGGVMSAAHDASEKLIEQWKKEDDAAKQHAAALEALFKRLSGADAAAQMRDLDAVFRRMAASGQITAQQVKEIATEAVKLAAGGATLTPRLWDIVLATDAFNKHAALVPININEIGTKIDVVAPKLDEVWAKLNAPIPYGISHLKQYLDPLIVWVPNAKEMAAKTHDVTKELGDLSQAFAQIARQFGSGNIFGSVFQSLSGVTDSLRDAEKANKEFSGSAGVASAMFSDQASTSEKWAAGIQSAGAIASGALSVWNSTAGETNKAMASLKGAMSGAEAGAVFGPWGAAIGAAAGALTGFLHSLFGTAGRDAVTKYVSETFGSFDEFQKHLSSLVASGQLTAAAADQMWQSLTQGTGRNNPEQAAKNIKAVEDALKNLPQSLAAAAGYQTRADLQAVADKAKQVYDYMVSSGQYSASQIADAYQKMRDAQIAAMDDTSKAAYDAAVAARDNAKSVIDALDGQIKTLEDSVAKEAPEAVRGAVEEQERAQLDSLRKQREEAQKNLDDANQGIQDAADAAVAGAAAAAKQAGQATVDAIGDALDHAHFHVKVTVDTDGGGPVPMASGGFGRVRKPTLFLAGEAGDEDFAFSGGGRSFGGGAGGASQSQRVTMRWGTRVITQEVVRGLPRELVLQGY